MADPLAPTTVQVNPDETSRTLMPGDDRLTRVIPPDIDAAPDNIINALFAAQIAVYDILMGLKVWVGDSTALVKGRPGRPVRQFVLERITFDHPKNDDEFRPLHAAIMEENDQRFDEDHVVGMIKADYDDCHSLIRLSHVTCFLAVEAWFGHKEERRAFRTAAQRAFLKEPLHERSDRLVVVPQYFGQQCRLTLTRARFPEDAQLVLAGRWPLSLSIEASLDEVMLVPRKAGVRVETRVHAKI